MHKGSCLCKAVTFTVKGDLKTPDGCHCTACRKSTGHFLVSTEVTAEMLTIEGAEHIRWYPSSDKVRRGFCATCGSTLFFDPLFHDWTAIAMGAFDSATRVQLGMHIFVADKGDYYQISDGLPQNQQ